MMCVSVYVYVYDKTSRVCPPSPLVPHMAHDNHAIASQCRGRFSPDSGLRTPQRPRGRGRRQPVKEEGAARRGTCDMGTANSACLLLPRPPGHEVGNIFWVQAWRCEPGGARAWAWELVAVCENEKGTGDAE